MNKKRPNENELWEKIDPIMFDIDLDLMEMLDSLDNGEYLNQIYEEDLILGLSGVDDEAIDRVETRKKSINKIKKELLENKIKRNRSAENMDNGRGSFKRSLK